MDPPSEAGIKGGDRHHLLPASSAPLYLGWQVLAFLASPLPPKEPLLQHFTRSEATEARSRAAEWGR